MVKKFDRDKLENGLTVLFGILGIWAAFVSAYCNAEYISLLMLDGNMWGAIKDVAQILLGVLVALIAFREIRKSEKKPFMVCVYKELQAWRNDHFQYVKLIPVEKEDEKIVVQNVPFHIVDNDNHILFRITFDEPAEKIHIALNLFQQAFFFQGFWMSQNDLWEIRQELKSLCATLEKVELTAADEIEIGIQKNREDTIKNMMDLLNFLYDKILLSAKKVEVTPLRELGFVREENDKAWAYTQPFHQDAIKNVTSNLGNERTPLLSKYNIILIHGNHVKDSNCLYYTINNDNKNNPKLRFYNLESYFEQKEAAFCAFVEWLYQTRVMKTEDAGEIGE